MDPLTTTSRKRAVRALAVVTALASLAACSDDKASAPPTTPLVAQKITVTFDASSPESELLTSIYAQALENAGYRIGRKNPLPDRLSVFQAVVDNEVQLVVEHTASLITLAIEQNAAQAGSEPPDAKGPAQQRAALQTLLPPTVVVSTPAPALRNEVIACTEKANSSFPVTNISALAGIADQLTIGAVAGFDTSLPLGLGSLKEVYNLEFKAYVPLAPEEVEAAIDAGTVDCIATDSFSPVIAAKSLTLVEDDKFLVPTDAVVPLMTTAAAGADVIAIVDAVSATISTTELSQMLDEMATNGTSADVVAKAFLEASRQ